MELKPKDGESMKGNRYIRTELVGSPSDPQEASQEVIAAILAHAYEQRTANLLDAYQILQEHGDTFAGYINPRKMAAHIAYRLGFGTDDE